MIRSPAIDIVNRWPFSNEAAEAAKLLDELAGRLYAIAEALGVPLSLFFVGIEEGTVREPIPPDTTKAPEVLGEMIRRLCGRAAA